MSPDRSGWRLVQHMWEQNEGWKLLLKYAHFENNNINSQFITADDMSSS